MNPKLVKNCFAKVFCLIFCCYFTLAAMLCWIAGEQMEAETVQTDTLTPAFSDGGMVGTRIIQQPFRVDTDTLDEIRLFTGTYGRENQSQVTVQIFDGYTLLWGESFPVDQCENFGMSAFPLDEPLQGIKGKELVLQIYTVDVPVDQAISFYYGNTISAGKIEMAVDIDRPAVLDGQSMEAELCMSLVGRNFLTVKQLYWPAVCLGAAIIGALYFYSYRKYRRHGTGLFVTIRNTLRYTFLMKQLIARDFKTKYKRSVLGVLWSFLNPLLTMSVQYVIFSSLFQSTIENFAVYLLTGIVIFNFFSEAVGLGLSSIVSNAPLITKVYVPKYIYPTTRVLSSMVNVLISMIPLCVMIIFSGAPIKKALFLLPLPILYTTVFCIGMSLLLSSSMVFFRDTQFLWGILSMLWMYMTPIFYPESIIPQQFIGLYHMNPLYQFIYFFREIIINGVAPSPYTFLYCTLAAGIPLLLGVWVFRKTQDRFVFYL